MNDQTAWGIDALPTEHTSLLGRIAAKHAQLDGIAQTLLGALVGNGETVQQRARSLVEGQSTSELARLIKKLAEESKHARAELLRDWSKDLGRLGDHRNQVLHANWIVLPDGRTITMNIKRTGTKFDGISIGWLRELESCQDTLIRAGLNLAKELQAE